MKFLKPLLGVVFSSVMALSAYAQQAPITLHGASQFGDDHAFTKAMVKFEELVKKLPNIDSPDLYNLPMGIDKAILRIKAKELV